MTAPVRTCCRCKTTQDLWYAVLVPNEEPWPDGWAPMCRGCFIERQAAWAEVQGLWQLANTGPMP